MSGHSARALEEALGILWELVEGRLTQEDLQALGIKTITSEVPGIGTFVFPANDSPLEELYCFGRNGPVGIGLGRYGGHAVGD